MKILITGVCGFVGSTLAKALARSSERHELLGIDNLIRPGSEANRRSLVAMGIRLWHADLRMASDLEDLPGVDYVIDAAAHPSVLAGVDGKVSSRQLVEHNLLGTINLLEFCKARRAGLILLSTSRVYSLGALSELPVTAESGGFVLDVSRGLPAGVSARGIAEDFATTAPVSLYGATKVASEQMALEYSSAFSFPVFVNRCGVLAGAGQFGRPDQGIFAFWVNSYLRRKPMKYIGFGGQGAQVRDCLHPLDLLPLIESQMKAGRTSEPIINCSGGATSARSLAQISAWCEQRFGFGHPIEADPKPRPYDLPWVVLDSSRAKAVWGWEATTSVETILKEIAEHAEAHPNWLDLSSPQ